MGGFRDTLNPVSLRAYPTYKYSIESNSWSTAAVQDPSLQRTYSPNIVYNSDFAIMFGGLQVSFEPTRINEDCFHTGVAVYDIGK
jgi:hypothetical protein